MSRLHHLVVGFVALCGVLTPGLGTAAQDLDPWLSGNLLPYLAARLGRHPRLKGEPFRVVAVKNDQLVAEMDGLTAFIRQRIIDQLEATPGANLVRPLPRQPLPAVQDFDDLRCPEDEPVKVQVTVDLEKQAVGDGMKLSVQAIDLQEHRWVRGFKKVWVGQLTDSQQQLLTRRYVDKSLLGSRELPFTRDQPDLLAAYLATDIGCALRSRSGQDIVLHLSAPQKGASRYFQRVTDLLARDLETFQEIVVARDAGPGEVQVNLQVHQINTGRFEVWSSLETDTGSPFMRPGAAAYVALSHELHTAGRDNKGTLPANDQPRALIAAFRLISPPDQSLCKSENPWQKGYAVLGLDTHLPSGACFAIRYQAATPSTLYLYAHTGNAEVVQLLPNTCAALDLYQSMSPQTSRRKLHIPLFEDGSPGYFLLDQRPGIERIYAIAMANPALADVLRHRIGPIPDLCMLRAGTAPHYWSESQFRKRIEAFAASAAPGQVDWRILRFVHQRARFSATEDSFVLP